MYVLDFDNVGMEGHEYPRTARTSPDFTNGPRTIMCKQFFNANEANDKSNGVVSPYPTVSIISLALPQKSKASSQNYHDD